MKYIPFILLISILIIPAVTLLSLRKEIGLKQTEEYKKVFFHSKKDFRFSFISPKDRLNSIALKIWNLSLQKNKTIYFNLLSDQKNIRHLTLNDNNLPIGQMVRFSFPEITNSKNKYYTLILSAPDTQQDDVLGVYTNASDYPVMTTYHTLTSKSQLILNTYQNLADKILTDKIFIMLWVILISSFVVINKLIRI